MDIEEGYQEATIVPHDAVGLVVRANGEVELSIPTDGEFEWNTRQMALAQVAMRLMEDPDWVQELADELQASAN